MQGRELGHGHFGKVLQVKYIGEDTTAFDPLALQPGQNYALKMINLNKIEKMKQATHIFNEKKILL